LEKKQPGLLAGSIQFFIGYLLVFAARFVTSIIVARTLGVEGKGVYALVLMVGAILVLLLSLGMGNAITYYTASGQYDSPSLFKFSLAATALLSLAGGVFFYYAYQVFLSERILAGMSLEQVWLVILCMPFSLLTVFLSSIVHGKQQFFAYNVISVARVFSNLFFQIIATLTGSGITGAIIAWLGSNIFALVINLWYVRADIRFTLTFPARMLKPLASYGLKNYVTNLLTFFNLRLDTFFVNFFSGTSMVGLYSTGVSTAELVWYVPNAIGSALFPKSSTMGKENAARVTAQISRQIVVVSSVLIIAAAFLGSFFIPLLYGPDFRAAVLPFLWLLPGIFGISIIKIIASNLGGIGKPEYASYTAAITLGATIILDFILIPGYSIVGAAIASSISYLLSAGLLIGWFHKETRIPYSEVLIPHLSDIFLLVERVKNLWKQRRMFWEISE
jgi:O-antigen/teichoic acid export membrane protein